MPTPGAAGGRRRPAGCCPTGIPGTTRRADGEAMRAVDPRLLTYARAARSYLIVTVLLGLVVTGLIVAQAALLAHALAAAARGIGAAALAGTLLVLLVVVAARGAAAYGGEAAALRAA